ncbi:trypsin-like serine peptidase [Streptomyces sp. NPDC054796]
MAVDEGARAASSMETPKWAVRIRGTDGQIVGAGVLLSPDRVLTCAHVVDDAGQRITAEFVGAANPRVPSVTARVITSAYVPEDLDADNDPSGDVALLRLEHPRPPEDAVRLHRLSVLNREVQMYGFPRDHNGGIWLRATAVGCCGRDGQGQLFPASPGELPSYGCSGAGVADSQTGKVFGIVLNKQESGEPLNSFMASAETIVRHLPDVHAFTVGRTAVDDRLRTTDDDASECLLDEPFAQRLAAWMRGDGPQVKISVVLPGDGARAATLRRAITLADRELRTRASLGRTSNDPPGTVPLAGGHDLAVDAEGLTCAQISERIAERMGLWPHPTDSAADRIRAAKVGLKLVVVGVDRAVDPPVLLDLLGVLCARGSRLLLVFRATGDLYDRACYELLAQPARRAQLVERLKEITGPLAEALRELRRVVVPDDAQPPDLTRAYAALTDLTSTEGTPGQGPHLDRYERLAERAASRLAKYIEHLGRLRDRRDELIGRLRGYQLLHQYLTQGEEDPFLDALYLEAHALLQTRPCHVRTAEAAVDAYTREVDDRDGRRRGHQGRS